MRQAGANGDQARSEAPAYGDPEPAEHGDEQRRHSKLDDERQRGQVSHASEDHELQRAGLQHRIGERVRPARREQPLAAMHEIDEVARVSPSVEGRDRGRGGEDRCPDAGERRAQKLPHQGRYRPSEE